MGLAWFFTQVYNLAGILKCPKESDVFCVRFQSDNSMAELFENNVRDSVELN